MTNLRPDLIIKQEFVNAPANAPSTSLPVLLIGLNRELHYREASTDLDDWSGEIAASGYVFPGWSGGKIEASEAPLSPKVYVSNEYGVAQIEDVTFNLAAATPTFSIAAGAEATFEVATGTSGIFAVNTTDQTRSTFTNTNADFVVNRVSDNDVILVNGIPTFKVQSNGLVSDTELTVFRVDKGSAYVGPAEASKILLTAEDSDDIRTLSVLSQGFADIGGFTTTGVSVGNLVWIDHWEVRSEGAGILYTAIGESTATLDLSPGSDYALTSSDRLVTLPSGSAGSYTTAYFSPEAADGTVFFTQNDSYQFAPAFYALTAKDVADDVYVAVRDFSNNHLLPAQDADFGVAFRVYDYIPRSGTNFNGLDGQYTAVLTSPGYREFSVVGNFATSAVSPGDHVFIRGEDSIFKPMFEVIGVGNIESPGGTSDNDGTLVVKALPGLVPDEYFASNIDYRISKPASVISFTGASFTAKGVATSVTTASGTVTCEATERLFIQSGKNFGGDGVVPGDLIFSDTGFLAFIVKHVGTSGSATTLVVEDHPNSAFTLGSTTTSSAFGYSIRKSSRSDFRVKQVVDSTTLRVTQLATSVNVVPGTKAVKGAIFFQNGISPSSSPFGVGSDPALVTVGDSLAAVGYTVEKTLSGADLTGAISVSYAEILDADLGSFIRVTADTYANLLGAAVPGNPLALAAKIATQNTATEVYCLQVAENTTDGWSDALEAAKSESVYSIVPLTQNDTYLTAAQTHVTTSSLPDNKLERILYQSKVFSRQTEKTASQAGDEAVVTTTSGGAQTVIVQRDLSDDVIIGDEFTGTAYNGATETEFGGRITNIVVSGDQTTLTLVNDGSIDNGTTALSVVSWSISSKLLSDSEFKTLIAAYPTTLQNRRIRNVFPFNIGVTFTDSTGFYGTVDTDIQNYTVGGFYMCAMEAAKRAEYGPAKPLTNVTGSGIYSIDDPFKKSRTSQDTILNAGTYYMHQPGGVGTAVSTIRALTTDVTTFNFLEDIVTTQVDSFARKLRSAIRPILGSYVLDEGFFTVISTIAQGVRDSVIDAREMKYIQLTKITEDPDVPDSFLMDFQVTPFLSASRGTITIYI